MYTFPQANGDDSKGKYAAVLKAKQLGASGEDAASRYLRSIGYRILERNARFGRLEIDIVAFDPCEGVMVFVEVKTRSVLSEAYPIVGAVDGRKRLAIRLAAFRWVNTHRYDGPGRIDILSVHGGRVVDHRKSVGSDFF